MTDKKDIWKIVQGELKKSQPSHAYSTWFEPIRSMGLHDGRLLLELPNQFFYDWIQSHYVDTIERLVKKEHPDSIVIKYTVAPQNPLIVEEQSEISGTIKNENTLNKSKRSLNENYTFSSFIEGSHNQFAKAAAKNVRQEPGHQSFNPLVIYGGVGMGKTHLLHAIGNGIIDDDHKKNIVCASSEKFTLDFISSIQKNKTVEFSKSYRNADVLLIDDIQFFQGKEQTQEQFFHTFNELFQAGKQIVLTADRYPGEMVGLQDRLLSRFSSGLAVDIQPANYETRVAIVMEKAEINGLKLPYDIIELIGSHIKNNIRDLESTIIRLLAHSSLSNQEIDYSLAKKVIKERVGHISASEITVEEIIRKVSGLTNISEPDIVGKSRRAEIVEARQISIYLCRDVLGTSLASIGMHFSGRDHTTVLHACKVIEERKKKDKRVSGIVSDIKSELSIVLA
jgi:chromosomal replication initiator protein